jgi:hypothetical protein
MIMKLAACSFALASVGSITCAAVEQAMTRVLACKGDDAAMEVYLPQSVVRGRGVANVKLDRPIAGAYTLDLTAAEKGKNLEPIRVSLSADKNFVIVDQYTRKLPSTRVPVSGGTVNFDNRFGTNAKCEAFNSE